MFLQYYELAHSHATELQHVELDTVSQHLFDLAVLMIGARGTVAEEARSRGLAAARFETLKSSILAELENSALSLTGLSAAHQISPRTIQLMFEQAGEEWVFIVNGLSYLLVIWSLLSVTLPAPVPDTSGLQGIRRLLSGFQVAKRDPIVGRCLILIFSFSLFSLPFIGQMPTLADQNLGIAARSTEYGILYACFGVGALLGALSIGTVLAGRKLERVVRVGLVVFAGFLAVFSLLRTPAAAYPAILLVGLAYFAVITSLSTVLQQRLDDSNRGRVMALWIMGFGGTVPIGNLIAGPIIEATSVTAVVLAGAVFTLFLAAYADLEPREARVIDPALAD